MVQYLLNLIYRKRQFSFQDVSNSNFEPILWNRPYNLFDQDLFPVIKMTENVLLTFIIYTVQCIYIYIHNERLIIWIIVFSGENYLIIHEGVGPFTPIRILPFQSKKCFSQFKTIYCFM